LVEFALVLPLVAVLLFAMIEFARVWNAKQLLTDAAREGARIAVVGDPARTNDPEPVNLRIRSIVSRGGFDVGPEALAIDWTGFNGPSGAITEVVLTFPYNWKVLPALVRLVTFGTARLSTPINLESTARMRNE
jgi:hypothetical protein